MARYIDPEIEQMRLLPIDVNELLDETHPARRMLAIVRELARHYKYLKERCAKLEERIDRETERAAKPRPIVCAKSDMRPAGLWRKLKRAANVCKRTPN